MEKIYVDADEECPPLSEVVKLCREADAYAQRHTRALYRAPAPRKRLLYAIPLCSVAVTRCS